MWQSRAAKLLLAVLGLLVLYVVFKYASGALLPFVFAWAIGAAVYGLACKSELRLGGKQRPWSIFYISVFWCFLFIGLLLLLAKIGREISDFLSYLSDNGDGIIKSIEDTINSIAEIPSKLPFFNKISNGEMSDKAKEYIGGMLSGLLSAVTEKGGDMLAKGVGRLLVGTPSTAIAFLVCILSSIYIALDYGKIKSYFKSFMSPEAEKRACKIFARISKGLRGYLRAYFFLFLITFTQLYAGLLILGRKYALVIALIVAALDLLPLFGSGAVLVPWAFVLIAGQSYTAGVGMLVLFAIMTVVRQIAEPRLVGSSLGIHPLASLAAMFLGLRLMGFWGMLLAPIATLIAKELLEEQKHDRKNLKAD